MKINDTIKKQLHTMLDAALIEMESHDHSDQIIGGAIQSIRKTGNVEEVNIFGLYVTTNKWTVMLKADIEQLFKALGLEQRPSERLSQLTELLAHEPPKGGKVN